MRTKTAIAALVAAGATGGIVYFWLVGDGAASEHARLKLGDSATCANYAGLPPQFGTVAGAGMVKVPGGSFVPGSLGGYADERPAGTVTVAPFLIDQTEVTNAQFEAFVQATGYVTMAEREGGAAVFRQPPDVSQNHSRPLPWWSFVKGANWRHPEGPGSSIEGLNNVPVVQITRADALAYAQWLGRDLPTEAEWEWAARAGGDPEKIEREPRDATGKPMANFWQGVFPVVDSREDGYGGRAPVGCYPANGWHIHDLIGNVWEWTNDLYRGPHQPHGSEPAADLKGQRPTAPPGANYVIKGGSFLCAANYCARYRSTARHPQEDDLPTSHVGFRTVLRGQ